MSNTTGIWHVSDNGQRYGPFGQAEIAAMVAEGRISIAAQVWREGMPAWVPVQTILPTPPVYVPPQTKPKKDRTLMIVGICVGGAVLLGMLIWAVASKHGTSSPGVFGTPEPGFSIARHTGDESVLFSAEWMIVNEKESPLTISCVRLNGEFDCPISKKVGPYIKGIDESRSLPITLTIGESIGFLEFYWWEKDKTYAKDIVFVDVETNRGTFHFDYSKSVEHKVILDHIPGIAPNMPDVVNDPRVPSSITPDWARKHPGWQHQQH